MAFTIYTYGDPEADILLLQAVDDHDMAVIEKELSHIRELTADRDFCLTAVKVNDWNKDLSPWPAPAVFGDEDFGNGAPETLEFLLREVIPESDGTSDPGGRPVCSLGGLSDGSLQRNRGGVSLHLVSGLCRIYAQKHSACRCGISQPWRPGRKNTASVDVTSGQRNTKQL